MRELADDAVVLRTFRSGEADRVAVLWTRSHAKVRVVARGARRATSRLGAALEPLAQVRVDLVATRGEFFVARHLEHLAHRGTLRGDYDRLAAGFAVVEALDAIPAEGQADESLYELTVRVLDALDEPHYFPGLVPAAFYLRLLALDGSAPVLEGCVLCGRAEVVAFDAALGGVLCAEHRSGRALSAEGLALLRSLAGGGLGGALREGEPVGAAEVRVLAHEAIEAHFGRRLRAGAATAPLAEGPPLG